MGNVQVQAEGKVDQKFKAQETEKKQIEKKPIINELKPSSSPLEPTNEEIAQQISNFDFRINEIIMNPKVEIWKNGKLVKIIANGQLTKLSGTLNPAYGDQFISDIISDFKYSFAEAYLRAQNKRGKA